VARDGRYHRFATYPICRWSGLLGPKLVTGDRQAPEGFYTVASDQMNPNSRWHRSFNLGFPNAYDAARGRSGSALMVHGGCSSAGCYAMTNAVIDEIWRLTSAALAGGKQKRFQVQIYPFRMSEQNLMAHAENPHIAFWRQLKRGSDLFESEWLPPTVEVCQSQYRFGPGRTLEPAAFASGACAQQIVGGRAKKAL
jgi:murein L,D-transpeptidase YafK